MLGLSYFQEQVKLPMPGRELSDPGSTSLLELTTTSRVHLSSKLQCSLISSRNELLLPKIWPPALVLMEVSELTHSRNALS